ncbi:MAG: SIS domain-containing protein [Thermoprotei archaeon]
MMEEVMMAKDLLINGMLNGEELKIPDWFRKPNRVAFIGIGGSAIAGEIISWILINIHGILSQVFRGPEIPTNFFTDDTLVFIISYSGNTWETLAAFRSLKDINSMKISITSNGKLAEISSRFNIPVIPLTPEIQPRSSLYEQVASLLIVLDKLGIRVRASQELEYSKHAIERVLNSEQDRAYEIASMIARKSIVIYGYRSMSVAAMRWKTQFNENAKMTAWYETLTEANHNSLVSWGESEDLNNYSIILLRSPREESEPIRETLNWFQEYLSKRLHLLTYETFEESLLARILSACMMGDVVSVKVSEIKNIDAKSVRPINALKNHMEKWGIYNYLGLDSSSQIDRFL